MPLETISGTGRTSRREAGTTGASVGVAATWAKISAVFFAVIFVFAVVFFFAGTSAVISAVERGEGGGEKIKGRLLAADEKTGEADILSRNCQGTQRPGSARGGSFVCSLFIRLCEYRSAACRCQGSSDEIMTTSAT